MLGHISMLVGVGMIWLPDVDVAIAGLEPALPKIQRREALALSQLLIMGCTIPAAAMPVRAAREVTACPTAA
jgi:hypothetical protein